MIKRLINYINFINFLNDDSNIIGKLLNSPHQCENILLKNIN